MEDTMRLFEQIGIDAGYVILGLAVFQLILLILFVVLFIQHKKMEKNEASLQCSFQKIGLVKYDAFKEMGGKLSFSLCLLDNNDNGFLITSMHSTREGCYTYAKEIIKGESYVVLAEEERKALEQAKARAGSEELD